MWTLASWQLITTVCSQMHWILYIEFVFRKKMKYNSFLCFTIVFCCVYHAAAQLPPDRKPIDLPRKSRFIEKIQIAANVVFSAPLPANRIIAKAQEIMEMRRELKDLLQNYSIDDVQDMSVAGTLMRLMPFVPAHNKTIRIPRNSSIIDNDFSNEATFDLPDSDQFAASTAVVSFQDETNATQLDSRIMSPLVGLSFFNGSGDEKPIKNLANKIRIKIPLKFMDDATFSSKRLVCKYLDVATSTFRTDGVFTDQITKTHAYCNTSHLTDFVVMDDNSTLSSTTTTPAYTLSTTTSNYTLSTTTPPRTTTAKGKDCPFLSDCNPSPNVAFVLNPSTAILFFACVLVLVEINQF